MPLTYMGYLDDLRWKDQDCELWIGPTGDLAYHFHRPYPRPDENAGTVGRPLNAREEEIDPGFVILFVQASNPSWHRCIFLSVLNQFGAAVVYPGNTNTPPGDDRVRGLPSELCDLQTAIRALNGQSHNGRFSIQIDAGDRFLAKLALGLGALLLGDAFVSSTAATKLRSFLWGRSAELRAQHAVRGTSFLDAKDSEAATLMGVEFGHLLWVAQLGRALSLQCIFYGSQLGVIEITDEPEHWQDRIPQYGALYLVSPGRQSFFGPVELTEYVAAKLHPEGPSTPLKHFLAENMKATTPPPAHLDGTGGIMLIAGEFVPFVSVQGQRQILGRFRTEEEARAAYDQAVASFTAAAR